MSRDVTGGGVDSLSVGVFFFDRFQSYIKTLRVQQQKCSNAYEVVGLFRSFFFLSTRELIIHLMDVGVISQARRCNR